MQTNESSGTVWVTLSIYGQINFSLNHHSTLNNLGLTKAYWESLLVHPPNEEWEIIWIDDCSGDGTREWLKSIESEKCRVVLNEKNRGFAANNNIGAKLTRGDTLLFLNNDLILTQNWLPTMLQKLDIEPNAIITGNVQIQVASGTIDHAGVWFDLAGCPAHTHKGNQVDKLKGQGKYNEAVTAACWLVRKETFLEHGGFDEALKVACNDVDYCLKLHAQGYRNLWTPYCELVHHESMSRGYEVKPERAAAFQNEVASVGAKYPKLFECDPCYNPNLDHNAPPF